MDDRKTDTFGPYSLVAGAKDGVPWGVAWRGGAKVFVTTGPSIDDCFAQVQAKVEELHAEEARRRTDDPSVADTASAFQRLAQRLSEGQLRMLRAHYKAPGRRLTATELAGAADYSGYEAANLQYGRVGWMLYGELPTELPIRPSDGKRMWTAALAYADAAHGAGDGPEWVWEMRDYVAQALKAARIV
jgi:hypothetical protein